MAQLQKLEGKVELKCCADKVFEMIVAKKSDFPKVCSTLVTNIALNNGDWTSVGSTRKWDLIIGGKPQCLVERVEAIDEEKKTIHHSIIEGEMLNTHYKKLQNKVQVIPMENSCCIVSIIFEYEKMNQDAPEPHQLLEFGLASFKEVVSNLTKAN